jgi:hypothetical protein
MMHIASTRTWRVIIILRHALVIERSEGVDDFVGCRRRGLIGRSSGIFEQGADIVELEVAGV